MPSPPLLKAPNLDYLELGALRELGCSHTGELGQSRLCPYGQELREECLFNPILAISPTICQDPGGTQTTASHQWLLCVFILPKIAKSSLFHKNIFPSPHHPFSQPRFQSIFCSPVWGKFPTFSSSEPLPKLQDSMLPLGTFLEPAEIEVPGSAGLENPSCFSGGQAVLRP